MTAEDAWHGRVRLPSRSDQVYLNRWSFGRSSRYWASFVKFRVRYTTKMPEDQKDVEVLKKHNFTYKAELFCYSAAWKPSKSVLQVFVHGLVVFQLAACQCDSNGKQKGQMEFMAGSTNALQVLATDLLWFELLFWIRLNWVSKFSNIHVMSF